MQQKILLAEIPSHTDCCHGYTQKGLAEGVEGVSEAKAVRVLIRSGMGFSPERSGGS